MRYGSAALLALGAALASSACVSTPSPGSTDDPVYAALGQTVAVNGIKVTPKALLEDSRCPASVNCVWAGQVRIAAEVGHGKLAGEHELRTGQPVDLGTGSLELIDVRPARATPADIPKADYRFGLRYMTSP